MSRIFQFWPSHDKYIVQYNALAKQLKSLEKTDLARLRSEKACYDGKKLSRKYGKHHIIPRSVRPDLADDPNNIVYADFQTHMTMHWLLWKSDSKFARQLWFGCCFGRKHKIWNLPGGDAEYEQLKRDLKKRSKNNI